MKYLITSIDTFIKERKLFVSFYVETEWYPFIQTAFEDLPEKIKSLSVLELDILAGCHLEPSSFYQRGEKMLDGKVAYAENKFPKTWSITFDGTLNELRERHKTKTLVFQSVSSITVSAKENKSPYVKIRTNQDNVYFLKLHNFKNIVGIKEEEFYLLQGAFISPIMYKKGDVAEYNGLFTTITHDDKIVASLNIRIEGTLDSHYATYSETDKTTFPTKERNYQDNGEYRDRPSYEKYNGYNGYDDDTIDNAFEGDPDATWNVD